MSDETIVIIKEVLKLPVTEGRVVSMVSWRDKILIATDYGTIYELTQDWLEQYHAIRS